MRIFTLTFAALAGIAALPGLSTAQTLRDLTVVQAQAYEAGKPKPGALSVLTLLDRPDATYGLGETVRLSVKTNADAYITVLNVGASGRVVRLFPNSAQPDNRVRAGEAIEVPSAASGARITVSGPIGGELIKVIATSKPLDVIREDQLQGNGVFRSLDGGVDALERDLTVVTNSAPPGTDVAVVNQVIRTVPARDAASVAQSPIIPQFVPQAGRPATAGTQIAVVPATAPPAPQSGFPLLLATDRASYRPGERVVLAVTSLETCHLQVFSTNGTGAMRQLYPTRLLPNSRINALQTVMISGGPSPQSVVADGPGPETITASCTRDARPGRVLRSAEDLVPAEDRDDLERSLSLGVPSKPVGHARVTVNVAP